MYTLSTLSIMGAGQSSEKTSPAGGLKTGYYELLGVERQATEDEIKKGYRRKALELHPDRNYGNEEHATKVFAEVQAAYQVLSDPQERAWYDSHESAILRGDEVGEDDGVPTYENVRVTTADDLAKLVGKFNSGIDFSDAPSGFFGFLRETFEQLAKEEEIAASMEGDEAREYPTFGHKDDEYDGVVKGFYAAWSSFATGKNFAWKDKYRLSEAPDRWYRRRMEQENKKFRQDGIREFNDAVRSLVAFVRKRDPRYVPSTQTEEERQKVLRDAAAAQAVRAKLANEAKLNAEVPAWTKSREPDPLAEMEGTFDEEEEEEHVFECVACNKIFKSEKQWEAHEKSKKHQKAVYALQKKMRKDNANLDLSGAGSGAATPDVEVEEEDDVLEEDQVELTSAEGTNGDAASEIDDHVSGNEDAMASEDISDNAPSTDTPATETAELSHSEDEDYASVSAIQARLGSTKLSDDTATPPAATMEPDEDENDTGEPGSDAQGGKKMGKAAQKRAKRAAAASTESQAEANHKCVGCNAAFPTKTRLFQHLKDHSDHAALKPGSAAGGGKKKGRGKK
ncbi:hypothetical protein LTR91_015922 [Friedmanniomyces endolithicus]|uniref:J domain-containing protein n=2 Tax=Friedmanniomyces endolithicus TaxID=329885 RepID=A0AAN6QLI1_9PEZI|nr:hypothetical protein LTR35_002230 [Friedmanniomyces endolithicus]KAK0921824.1 hypothetical protein LTR57_008409 [Friedmanniomyces endolithicus]KAK0970362.1 hypothetical protein LTR91_015922 [Friedmanniomyces endolithicus]KAK1002729.1 hypothetical protein LTR54_008122 [Friedmanniomyces endolithicus]KAK1003748.1 hypothetical protein LTS01_003931 [Friedmanniomyces endolithicus]